MTPIFAKAPSRALSFSIHLNKAARAQERYIVPKNKPQQIDWRMGKGGAEVEHWRAHAVRDLRAFEAEKRSVGYSSLHSFLKIASLSSAVVIVVMSVWAFSDIFRSGGITEYKQAQMVPRKPTIQV